MQTIMPFILGGVFAALACLQHTHSVRGLWRRSIITSMGLGGIQYLLVRWAAKGDIAFWIFQAGCCLGAGLGSYLSSHMGKPGTDQDEEFCVLKLQQEEVNKRA